MTQTSPGEGPPGPAPQSGWRNWLTIAGAILASGSLFAFFLLLALDLMGKGRGNPYLGILCYVVAPSFLAFGLAVAAFGFVRRRRELARLRGLGQAMPIEIDLTRSRDRTILKVFIGGACVYLVLTAFGSYQTYLYTESDSFCGEVCHSVMGPELTAYRRNAHARVACVDCHVGEGAKSYISAKINGVHQLVDITLNRFPRPIPTPIHNLRPARETCERCHWPEKRTGDLERIQHRYLADATNSPYSVTLLLKVGGGGTVHGVPGGIHWHTNPDSKVEYLATDPQRQVIPWMRVTEKGGRVTVYRTKAFKGEPDPAALRTMDCLDCHNRPAHRFSTPNDAVDEALYLGRMDVSLPSIKKAAVDLLTRTYATSAQARDQIAAGLRNKYGAAKGVDGTIEAVQAVYSHNFFPEMKADWSQYPENIGHMDTAGCFRCHDEKHVAAGGAKMPATDCDSCHVILAQGAGAELTQLSTGGVAFKHPSTDIEGLGLTCSDCHNGKNQDN